MIQEKPARKPILEVSELKVQFFTRDGVLKAVRNISFELYPGESIGIVGESGCGKSVTALSLMRLIPVPPGRIQARQLFFDGIEILGISEEKMREFRGNRISMIFQDPMTSLNPVLTIEKQLGEILELHLGLRGQERKKRCIELLQVVGISEPEMRLQSYPHQLSGGMRQRVMIAMALSCTPNILIADEPTTALDVTIQDQILRLIRSLAKNLHAATILITHNFGAVAGTTDRILVMYAGEIVEMASTIELFHDPFHPYTRSLIKSIPRLDHDMQRRLYYIPGSPPNLLRNLVKGCSFEPRCELRTQECGTYHPPMEEKTKNHFVACWKSNP